MDVAGVARLICGNLIEREMPRTTIYEHLDAGSSSAFRSHAHLARRERRRESSSPDRVRYSNESEMFILGETNCFDRRIIADNSINLCLYVRLLKRIRDESHSSLLRSM